jgi:hypothetical protein
MNPKNDEPRALEMFASCLRASQKKAVKVFQGAKKKLVQDIMIPRTA